MLKIDFSKWDWVNSTDLFESITIAKSSDLNTLQIQEDGFNYVGRTRENNGITAKVDINSGDDSKINEGNCITVVMVGDSTCSTFYQADNFYASQNMLVLRNNHINKYVGIFLKNIISQEKYRFSYGRTLTKGYFEKMKLKIPIKNDSPDWDFMQNYVMEIYEMKDKIVDDSVLKKQPSLDIMSWSNFSLDELFDISGSKTTSIIELEEGGIGPYPFVTTQATSNGVEGFYSSFTENGNILTIDSAVLGYCSYQPFDFSASDHVEKLIPKFEMDKYIGLFLATILNKEKYRYNYGRKASQTRLKERVISLPSINNIPDWDIMRNYIKSLPYSSNL